MLLDAGDVAPADVTLLGTRNLDPPEEAFLASSQVRREGGAAGPPVYVALDCDVLRPGELDVFMPEPGGPTLAVLEALLGGLPRPVGAGLTGLTWSERNEALVPRLVTALGM